MNDTISLRRYDSTPPVVVAPIVAATPHDLGNALPQMPTDGHIIEARHFPTLAMCFFGAKTVNTTSVVLVMGHDCSMQGVWMPRPVARIHVGPYGDVNAGVTGIIPSGTHFWAPNISSAFGVVRTNESGDGQSVIYLNVAGSKTVNVVIESLGHSSLGFAYWLLACPLSEL